MSNMVEGGIEPGKIAALARREQLTIRFRGFFIATLQGGAGELLELAVFRGPRILRLSLHFSGGTVE